MLSLHKFLYQSPLAKDLQHMILEIGRASKYAAHAIRTEETGASGNTNVQGETQLELDEKCDEIFCSLLGESDLVSAFASEEQEQSVTIRGNDGTFCVAFDPLDGSSLLDVNGCVGTIFGIWEGNDFIGKKGSDLVAAGYVQYGPRTIMIISFAGKTHEFTLSEIGEYHLSDENIRIKDTAKIFAPGNLRAFNEREEYKKTLFHCIEKEITLRYAGGMVPDTHSILKKRNGVFMYPSHSAYPKGKLRLLYECAPMAFIMENSGGIALDENGNSICEIKISDLHERTSLIYGSKNTVEEIINILRIDT